MVKSTLVTDRKQTKTDFHFPLLRLSDIILIYTEAVSELSGGSTEEAYKQASRIRTRSNATPLSSMNQDELHLAVLEEHARELACEADQRYDLFCRGIYLGITNATDVDEHSVTKRRTERNFLYLLPTSEVNANDKIDSDNPGR